MNTDKLEALLAEITPGPWAYEDPLGPEILTVVANTEAAPYDWVWVANIDTVPSLQEMAEDDRTFTEHESNARLIALAPDLLAEVIRLRGEAQAMRDLLNTGCDLVSVEVDEMKSTISVGGEMSPDEADQPIVELIREAEDWIARVGAMINTTGGSDA